MRALAQPPTMSEKEWRRLGLRAMPTRKQLRRPAFGCCTECGIILTKDKNRFNVLVIGSIAFIALFMTTLLGVYTVFRS